MSDIRIYRNVASQTLFFELLTAAGVAVTTGVVTGYVTKDADAQGALAGTITHVGGGQYRVDLAQADTNATTLAFLFTHATAVPVGLTVSPDPAPASATALSGTWSYDPTLLQSTTAGTYTGSTVGVRNQIRLLIQDTQSTRPLLLDAEIDWYQTQEANTYMAAAACCDMLVAKAGNVKTRWIGDLRVTIDSQFYRGLALMFRARGAGHQVPFSGGISISDKQLQQDDPDAVQPKVFKTLLDNQRAEQPTPSVNNDSFQQVP